MPVGLTTCRVRLVVGRAPKGVAPVRDVVIQLAPGVNSFPEQPAHEKRIVSNILDDRPLARDVAPSTGIFLGLLACRDQVDDVFERSPLLVAHRLKKAHISELGQYLAHVLNGSRRCSTAARMKTML